MKKIAFNFSGQSAIAKQKKRGGHSNSDRRGSIRHARSNPIPDRKHGEQRYKPKQSRRSREQWGGAAGRFLNQMRRKREPPCPTHLGNHFA